MFMNNEFKQFREIVENRDGSVIAHGGMIASSKYWYNCSFFPCSREILLSQAQVEYMPNNGNENSSTAFDDEARDIKKSDRFRRF
jgi:hypothetical protein